MRTRGAEKTEKKVSTQIVSFQTIHIFRRFSSRSRGSEIIICGSEMATLNPACLFSLAQQQQLFYFLFNYANSLEDTKRQFICRDGNHERIATSWAENLAACSEWELSLFMAEIFRTIMQKMTIMWEVGRRNNSVAATHVMVDRTFVYFWTDLSLLNQASITKIFFHKIVIWTGWSGQPSIDTTCSNSFFAARVRNTNKEFYITNQANNIKRWRRLSSSAYYWYKPKETTSKRRRQDYEKETKWRGITASSEHIRYLLLGTPKSCWLLVCATTWVVRLQAKQTRLHSECLYITIRSIERSVDERWPLTPLDVPPVDTIAWWIIFSRNLLLKQCFYSQLIH